MHTLNAYLRFIESRFSPCDRGRAVMKLAQHNQIPLERVWGTYIGPEFMAWLAHTAGVDRDCLSQAVIEYAVRHQSKMAPVWAACLAALQADTLTPANTLYTGLFSPADDLAYSATMYVRNVWPHTIERAISNVFAHAERVGDYDPACEIILKYVPLGMITAALDKQMDAYAFPSRYWKSIIGEIA